MIRQQWKWDAATKELRDYLLGLATEALAEPEPDVPNGIINSKNSGRILIESGREALQRASGLFFVLDALEDRERESAYSYLYSFISGTMDIAGYAITPSSAIHQLDEANAARMRRNRSAAKAARDEIVRAVAAKNSSPPKRLLGAVNDQLMAAGEHRIGERTLRRIVPKRGHS